MHSAQCKKVRECAIGSLVVSLDTELEINPQRRKRKLPVRRKRIIIPVDKRTTKRGKADDRQEKLNTDAPFVNAAANPGQGMVTFPVPKERARSGVSMNS